MHKELCQILDWDSQFFEYKIARITSRYLQNNEIVEIIRWCKRHAIDCLYWFAAPDDAAMTQLAEIHNFHLVDIRLTFQKQIEESIASSQPNTCEILTRLSTEQDIPRLKALARRSYRDTRFYYDPHFSKKRCDELYETWIEKSCKGYADAVVVTEFQSQAVGYVSCHLIEPGKGKIGLIGVAPEIQGKGLGKRLIGASLDWFAEREVQEVMVSTQGRNIKAQRLYQRCGFLTETVTLVYHRWFQS